MADSSDSVSIDMEALSLGGQVNYRKSFKMFCLFFVRIIGKNKIREMVLY